MTRHLAHWEVADVAGPVVAIDVIRAFTAAYAFDAGAREIQLVETLAEASALLDAHPTWLAMGEDRGRRPDRFALSNSPVHASTTDLDGRTIIQRTSAGTRGALAARHAEPLLCAGSPPTKPPTTTPYCAEGRPECPDGGCCSRRLESVRAFCATA